MDAKQSLKSKPLRPRQLNALQMVIDGFTSKEIQERLGITHKTLWNWRQLPAWDDQISLVLRDASGDGEGQIKSMLPLATARLKKLIHSSTETVALGAVRTALEAHANLIQRQQDHEALQLMEQQLAELKDQVFQQQAAALGPAVEAEIVDVAHVSAHDQPIEQQELAL
jgi:FixJ family two-component response regulator